MNLVPPVRSAMLAFTSHLVRHSRAMTSRSWHKSSIPIFFTVPSFREWRETARKQGKSVGLVATMGALHQGHLSLVEHSLRANDLTVVSIFVNPAQFGPDEDLDSYPRTLQNDIALLSTMHRSEIDTGLATRSVGAVFAPPVVEMYPNGIAQGASSQNGTFVEVKGYSHQMEGSSRPDFFRGVATVVTKLFHVIEPANAYFGQKDIQQALLLRRLCADLLFSHPAPQNIHIVATARAPSGLALSSRNTYLSESELPFAITLFEALQEGERVWKTGLGRDETVKRAAEIVERRREEARAFGVTLRLDYLEVNNAETFEVVEERTQTAILSGALWVGRTRLIDNVLLGDCVGILC